MISSDESQLTLSFKDHYVIKPSIKFTGWKIDYKKNKLGEKGVPVKDNFSYDSNLNEKFLNLSQIKKYLNKLSNDPL